MRNVVYRIWPFLSPFRIPAYLEWMEAEGLHFERICPIPAFAAYRRAEPAETRYCWGYFEPRQFTEVQDYLDACRWSGWEVVWQFDRNKIFWAVEGREPVSLYTDEESEAEAIRQMGRKESHVWLSLLLAALFAFLFAQFKMEWIFMPFFSQMIWVLMMIMVLAMSLQSLWYRLVWGRRKRLVYLPPFVEGDAAWGTAGRLAIALVFVSLLASMLLSTAEGNNISTFGVVWLSYWMNQCRFILNNSEGYPEEKKMKGMYHYSEQTCRRVILGCWAVLAVWVVFCSVIMLTVFDGREVSSRNLFFDVVRVSEGNRYYLAKNEEEAERLTETLVEMEEMNPAADGERLRGRAAHAGEYDPNQALWDDVAADDGRVIIRSGREIWNVYRR